MVTTMQFKNVFNGDYEPGHIEMWYGQNYTPLFELTPENPQEGDIKAVLTVNGEWAFTIKTVEGEDTVGISGDYYEPYQITPAVEKFIKNTYCEEELVYQGTKYEISWSYNNWFEIFMDEYLGQSAGWIELSYDVVDGLLVGPTEAEAKNLLETWIENY